MKMESVFLFELVNRQRVWLSARQSLVSQNIANANTPGYRTLDVTPFAKALDRSALEMSAAHPSHLRTFASDPKSPDSKPGATWEITHSGNSVSLEQEMLKAGDIHSSFARDSNILKMFHNMWRASLKG
jgi:flagellar basal-body rod protein FlgB